MASPPLSLLSVSLSLSCLHLFHSLSSQFVSECLFLSCNLPVTPLPCVALFPRVLLRVYHFISSVSPLLSSAHLSVWLFQSQSVLLPHCHFLFVPFSFHSQVILSPVCPQLGPLVFPLSSLLQSPISLLSLYALLCPLHLFLCLHSLDVGLSCAGISLPRRELPLRETGRQWHDTSVCYFLLFVFLSSDLFSSVSRFDYLSHWSLKVRQNWREETATEREGRWRDERDGLI